MAARTCYQLAACLQNCIHRARYFSSLFGVVAPAANAQDYRLPVLADNGRHSPLLGTLYRCILLNDARLRNLTYFSYLMVGHGFQAWDNRAALFGANVGVLPIFIVLLNPFFEELLVRAYLITEVESLFTSTSLAVMASVTLQTSYHLYQGVPNAISLSAGFLLFSLYFVRTRRILPIILAHLYLDVGAVLIYAHSISLVLLRLVRN